MPYKHLAQEERFLIQKHLQAGCPLRQIARQLERAPSTVSREIKRNRGKPVPDLVRIFPYPRFNFMRNAHGNLRIKEPAFLRQKPQDCFLFFHLKLFN